MTYSIAAADTHSREVGGAGTSCLSGQDVYVIYGGVPGRGVVHAQAFYNEQGRDRASELLSQGQPPADIVRAITQASFDRNAAIRQYGVVDVLGNAAGFTGTGSMSYAEDRQGNVDGFVYSVQGNILTSARVLDQAAAAFEAGGCDLAERLMSALEAGAQNAEGDSRCTPQGIPSDSAFLQVESPNGTPGDYLSLRVRSSGSDNPLPALRAQLDEFRAGHPCPVEPEPMTSMPNDAPGSAENGCGCRLAGAPSCDPALLLGCALLAAFGRRCYARLRP